MSVADTMKLPASPAALKALAESSGWEVETRAVLARSERRAWLISAASVGIAVLGMAAATAQYLKPPPAAKVLMVDKTTGETVVLPNLDDSSSVPQVAAMDLHNAAVYVRARESYNYSMLGADYQQVARMSTPELFRPYQTLFTGPEALHEKLKDNELRRVTVISVRPTTGSQYGRGGEALVTYEREVRNQSTTQPIVTRYTATVRYEYRPGAVKKDVDRLENPFGFVVTGYRTDAEVAASRIEPAAPAGGPSLPGGV
ncbi:type IV secretion system protein [Aquincola sp. S2]|uniref:Type IV secretion system protein n=1 Tax=Pseudaquabacterium terrae TaxID=2732868 RepID=A0ABX2ERM0_9BURK|nr:type IV secretion system protein [Aquabacterium terrae]NRF71372.1 type IV secretion system protein [Aquabacterium terrae]